MPTPVTASRACLTEEAAAALDEAVAVARRRGHAQTTSLHMVSSLLSMPNSSLREACTRTRNNAYSTRVQLKALELSLSVSLDRLPCSRTNRVEEPPVSNSLMAAIKRSQANQRRQPENFSFYQQQYSSCSSIPVVKVELRNLIISILDDPLVSRVFGEAGFRSCDIKIATLRPVAHHLFGYSPSSSSRYKRPPQPPLFLCNSSEIMGMNSKPFPFPFMASGEENYARRIGEIMLRDKKKNPLLLGVSASETLTSFLETVQKKVEFCVLPQRLTGLNVISFEDDTLRFVNGGCDDELMKSKFEEVEKMVNNSEGVVVNFGDLKSFAEEGVCGDALRYVVGELARLLQIYAEKLWLIGAASTYEIYYEFLNRYPSIDKDWDLEIFPITTNSLRFSAEGLFPRSSLMESFVPLGGFFSSPSDMKSPLSGSYLNGVRCHLCNEKCQQELSVLTNEGFNGSPAGKSQSTLPPWMQTTEHVTPSKVKDDGMLLTSKIADIQRKWDGICQRHHDTQPLPKINSHAYTDIQQSCLLKACTPLDVLSKSDNPNILSKSGETVENELHILKPNTLKSSSASISNGRTSPTSVTSVSQELSLHVISASITGREQEKMVDQNRLNVIQGFSGSLSTNSHSSCNAKDPKLLYKLLVEKVGQQEEAVRAVMETIAQRQTKNPSRRGDLWFNFRGPDKLGKKRLAAALCEMLYGNTENLICLDLSFEDVMTHKDEVLDLQPMNRYDATARGKTVIDYLAENLSKKPCLVFLENIDKADPVVQNRLSHAVTTGRFSDLQGREVNVRNSIFLTTTRFVENGNRETSKYSEESILRINGRPIQMLIGIDLNESQLDDTNKGSTPVFMSKRKLIGTDRICASFGSLETKKRAHKASYSFLDLNLPAEGSEIWDTCSAESDCDSVYVNSNSWLDEFIQRINKTIVFKPIDFDRLADNIRNNIKDCLLEVAGKDCSLEVEQEVTEQLLAASYLKGGKKVEDWIQHVLKQEFVNARKRFSHNACFVVKLVCCRSISEEETPQILLPSRIITN